MGSTLHFNFPVYSNEDKPSILHDYNTTITAIDNILYKLSIATGSSEEYEELIQQLQEQVGALSLLVDQNSTDISNMSGTIENVTLALNQIQQTVSGYDEQFQAMGDAIKGKLDKVTEHSFPVEPVIDPELHTLVIEIPYTEAQQGEGTVPESIKGFVPAPVFMYTTVNLVKFKVVLPDETEWVSDYALYPWAFYRGLWIVNTYVDEQQVNHEYLVPYFLKLNPQYNLPIASSDTLGGIKVGSGLTINEDGVLSASGGASGDYVPVFDENSFPLQVNYNPQMHRATMDIPLIEYHQGDPVPSELQGFLDNPIIWYAPTSMNYSPVYLMYGGQTYGNIRANTFIRPNISTRPIRDFETGTLKTCWFIEYRDAVDVLTTVKGYSLCRYMVNQGETTVPIEIVISPNNMFNPKLGRYEGLVCFSAATTVTISNPSSTVQVDANKIYLAHMSVQSTPHSYGLEPVYSGGGDSSSRTVSFTQNTLDVYEEYNLTTSMPNKLSIYKGYTTFGQVAVTVDTISNLKTDISTFFTPFTGFDITNKTIQRIIPTIKFFGTGSYSNIFSFMTNSSSEQIDFGKSILLTEGIVNNLRVEYTPSGNMVPNFAIRGEINNKDICDMFNQYLMPLGKSITNYNSVELRYIVYLEIWVTSNS